MSLRGNGGLGRLAACFIDSGMSTLGLPGDGGPRPLSIILASFIGSFLDRQQMLGADDRWLEDEGVITVEFRISR